MSSTLHDSSVFIMYYYYGFLSIYMHVYNYVVLCNVFMSGCMLRVNDVCLSTGNRCRPVPMVGNATCDKLNQSTRGALLRCFDGHRFPDGTEQAFITCNADGSWDTIPPCKGNNNTNFFQFPN